MYCCYYIIYKRERLLSLSNNVTLLLCYSPQSMPYCRQIHLTALGGSMWLVGFTPKRDNLFRFCPSHRWNVLRLTPAASASSYLYALFIVFLFAYKGTKKAREMQINLYLFSLPSETVARRSQGTTFSANMQENHGKFKWNRTQNRHIQTKDDSTLFGCRNFAVDLKIHRDFGLRLGIEMSSFSALALHQSCIVKEQLQGSRQS